MNAITPTLRKSLALRILILLSLLPGLGIFSVPLQANPSGASVVAGNVNFQGLGTANLDINNLSNNAIINWQSFSIQNGETTRINQGANAFTLNRVTSGNPTAIYGSLVAAQGGVAVINPNGILVGPNGMIDIAGMLTLSTLDIDDDDFLNGGNNRFTGSSTAGIQNYGAISSADSDVVLLGNFLQNSGSVSAVNGTVAFGAGGDMIVEQTVSGSTISVLGAGPGGEVGIDNSGSVTAAAAEFKAHGNVYSLAIQNDGVVRANGYNFKGGKLTLSAGSGGRVVNTGQLYARSTDGTGGRVQINAGSVSQQGTIDVAGTTGGSVSIVGAQTASNSGVIAATGSIGNGGSVDITADSVSIASSSVIDVSGVAGGGSVRAGGGFQGNDADIANAEATTVSEGALFLADSADGDAGDVIVWADGTTTFEGAVSAQAFGAVGNGGLVEVSGKDQLFFAGTVSTLSANGRTGTLLLDPQNVVIGPVGGADVTITDLSITTALAANNVVIHTSSDPSIQQEGNILVQFGSDLKYSSENDLSLFAHGDIIINDHIQNAWGSDPVGRPAELGSGGNITLFAGWNGDGAANFGGNAGGGQVFPSGTGVSFADLEPASTYGMWGNSGGDVVINGVGDGAVGVGSATGETNVLGDDVDVAGGTNQDRFGQIGFFDASFDDDTDNNALNGITADGDINVRAATDVTLNSTLNDPTGGNNGNNSDSHVMIGHGGSNAGAIPDADRSGNGDLAGDISVVAEGTISMFGGNDRAFAQIGHGGRSVLGDKDGSITVEGRVLDMRGGFLPNSSLDALNRAGSRIGHGGYDSHGDGNGYSGDVTVTIAESVFGTNSDLDLTGNSDGQILQIGHGGYRSGVVDAAGVSRDPLSYTPSGQNTDNGDTSPAGVDYAMEGHTGTVTVDVGRNFQWTLSNIRDSGGHIGHGGRQSHGNHLGDVIFNVDGDVAMLRSAGPNYAEQGDNSPFHIGNGGNRTGGSFRGNIEVDIGGSLEMHGADSTSFVQIGHGGFADGAINTNANNGRPLDRRLNVNNAHATLSGDITVMVGGDLGMFGGTPNGNAYAMIGHGGVNRIATGVIGQAGPDGGLITRQDTGHHGNIRVESGGAITVQGDPEDPSIFDGATGGGNNFAQIGHGGIRSSGDHYGEISVSATDDLKIAAADYGSEFLNAAGDNFSDQQSGNQSFGMIGHGGFASHAFGGGREGDNNVSYQDNGFHLNASNSTDDIGFGAVTSRAETVTLPDGSTVTFSAITNSNISVNAGGNFDLLAAQEIGGFRPGARALLDADPTREFSARGQRHFALVGHGGFGETGTNREPDETSVSTGDININVGENLSLAAGQIGQDAAVPGIGGNDRLDNNFVQIGHGGANLQSNFAGAIDILAGGDVNLQAGRGLREPARIGHGGPESGLDFDSSNPTSISGEISVRSLGNIRLLGGDDTNVESANNSQFNFAQIGHGIGVGNRVSSIDADITVSALQDLVLQAGASYQDAYTQIGHGFLQDGNGEFSGTIDVTSGRDIILSATSGNVVVDDSDPAVTQVAVRNFAKIGHGDTDSAGRAKSEGTWNGDILVKAGRDLTSSSGMIGHADVRNGDSISRSLTGNTFIAVGRNNPESGSGDLTTDSGTRFSSSQLGNGSELRLYIPGIGGVDNFIADGTGVNEFTGFSTYTRTPFPDGTRADEVVATGLTLMTDADGAPIGSFTPQGTYTPSGFGNYTVFYADIVPAPPILPSAVGPAPLVVAPFAVPSLTNFLFEGFFDAFDRQDSFFADDGYGDGLLEGLSFEELTELSGDPKKTGFGPERALDSVFGKRRAGAIREPADAAILEAENAEEFRRRQLVAERQIGRGGNTYYLYLPGTNKYSSLRMFGLAQGGTRLAQ